MMMEQSGNAMVARAAEGLRKSLISAKHIMRKALETSFRRGAKFKNPVRIEINNLVLANSKLAHAIALAYAKGGAGAAGVDSKKITGVKAGQEVRERTIGSDGRVAGVIRDADWIGCNCFFSSSRNV